MKKLKMIGFSVLGLLVFILMLISIIVSCAPQFGKSYDKKTKENYSKLENFSEGHFQNTHNTEMEIDYWDALKKQFKKDTSRSPSKDIIPQKLDPVQIAQKNGNYLTWLGHSAFLLELEGKVILLDPMLGESPAPYNFLGPKRYSSELAIEIEQLPEIDFLLISHDHYDHLDYPSILKLQEKVKHFYVPLGVGAHLKHWGVPAEKIQEMNWWETTKYEDLTIVFTPARHFSGRGILDRNKTLWGSWIIQSENKNIYFSGDGGYDTHFKEIGEKYGPFDLSLMECGQYNEQWKLIHMMPEETVIAAMDLKSKIFIPIHWGAFTLAFHSWTDPVVRASKKAKEMGMPISTPFIGERFSLEEELPHQAWWYNY